MPAKNRQIVERFEPNQGQEWLQNFVLALLDEVTPYVKDRIILDAGCGTGYNAQILLNQGAKHIDAYDISPAAINYAKTLYSDTIHFKIKDFNLESFKKEHYDITLSFEVIEHVENYLFYLKNLYKALKPHGYLFISTPNKDLTTNNNEFHLKEFNYDEFKDLLNDVGFTINKSIGIEANSISKVSSKITPDFVINFLKSLPFYTLLLRVLCGFKKQNPKNSGCMLFVCIKK